MDAVTAAKQQAGRQSDEHGWAFRLRVEVGWMKIHL